jgi:hypothetical protein
LFPTSGVLRGGTWVVLSGDSLDVSLAYTCVWRGGTISSLAKGEYKGESPPQNLPQDMDTISFHELYISICNFIYPINLT